MIEFVIGLAIAVALWRMRSLFYDNLEDFDTTMQISRVERELERQSEIKEMVDRVEQYKAEHGKWYTIKDIDHAKSK